MTRSTLKLLAVTILCLVIAAICSHAEARLQFDRDSLLSRPHLPLIPMPTEPDRELDLAPREVFISAGQATPIRVLSLNNSLIGYWEQFTMFNRMAESLHVDAQWTAHTLDGKTLHDHWLETKTGNARSLVMQQPWTHIILQEFTTRPRLEFEAYRSSVQQWVKYIRQVCPDAVIILPTNWAVVPDGFDTFGQENAATVQATLDVAREFGLTVCPIGNLYGHWYDLGGQEEVERLLVDWRHPSYIGAYIAAAMEFELITGHPATLVRYSPKTLGPQLSAEARQIASDWLSSQDIVANHYAASINFDLQHPAVGPIPHPEPSHLEADSGAYFVGNTLKINPGADSTDSRDIKVRAIHLADTITAIVHIRQASRSYPPAPLIAADTCLYENFDWMADLPPLPQGWRIDAIADSPRSVGSYHQALYELPDIAPQQLAAYGRWGLFNFGEATDRTPGALLSGASQAPRSANIYLRTQNQTADTIRSLAVSYTIKKFRGGTNRAGFAVALHSSPDGITWAPVDSTITHIAPDRSTRLTDNVNIDIDPIFLNITLPPGQELYLAWNISVATGTSTYSAPALGIDNVVIRKIDRPDQSDQSDRSEELDQPEDLDQSDQPEDLDQSDLSEELDQPENDINVSLNSDVSTR